MTRLAIVIATFNSEHEIGPCLAALAEAPPHVSHEVVVVDNASTDRTRAIVEQGHATVRLVRLDRNGGFAHANNVAIRATTSELVLLLNPDTVVRPGALDRLVQELDASSVLAACGPRLVDAAGRAELSFGRMMGPLNEVRQKWLVRGHARRWPLVTSHVERMCRTPAEHDWVSGACLLVRRADAVAVGLLDERYFLYGEDVDFCAALRARGRRIRFVPDAEVMHLRGRSQRSTGGQAARAYRASQLQFYAKHHPAWLPLLRAYLALRGLLP
jgi:N-acetylglucosaminyl-diphospho-decaprenol L-rhamnosyltransferase